MTFPRITLVTLLFVNLLGALHLSLAQDKPTAPSREKSANFMRAKLLSTQKIIEALALEDFDQLAKSSQELKLLSHESTWNVLETEQYVQHSMEFRRRADALSRAAKEKNLDGASLAFVELTLNCVHCHRHVRDVRNQKNPLFIEPKKNAVK